MRIREILFHDFRSFRGERRISFVDPDTDQVRPVTVLAGSNGSGKTTVLEAIEALLAFNLSPLVGPSQNDLLNEMQKSGFVRVVLELTPQDMGEKGGSTEMAHLAAGQVSDGRSEPSRDELALQWSLNIKAQERSDAELQGGWLYFPHDRRLDKTRGGIIEPPIADKRWLYRFSPKDRWRGSLEQLWVWQNYLDLEQREKRKTADAGLPRFVESVEAVLGENRRIFVEEGRVRVTVPYTVNNQETSVGLDQLPSGEQQVLLLFGELARRRRKGAVIAIDELENSLHPTLQRLVMWNLNRLAREWDAQVIVTTHSLEVINTVRGGALINLDYPEDRFNLPVPTIEASHT